LARDSTVHQSQTTPLTRCRLSVVINNSNYGDFLESAIVSSLNQSLPHVETIVVDDGSTDHSRKIIEDYGDLIIPVLKDRGGQTSAINAGFQVSSGDIVIFLDADDTLLPHAASMICSVKLDATVSKVHWPLWIIDKCGQRTGELMPRSALGEGELRELTLEYGPNCYASPPTSGNAWARAFLKQVIPLPEVEVIFGTGSAAADTYLSSLAPLYGRVAQVSEPLGSYRIHGGNDYAGIPFDEKMERDLRVFDNCVAGLAQHCNRLGLQANPSAWKQNAWPRRRHVAIAALIERVPEGETVILLDGGKWGPSNDFGGRHCISIVPGSEQRDNFLQSAHMAISALEQLRNSSAQYLVLTWTARGWLATAERFEAYLRERYPCIFASEEIELFDLHPSTKA
jgi:hypothetical protein